MARYIVFCFQAEDGIRYLVRSRGLGDVYKRQREDAAIEPRLIEFAGQRFILGRTALQDEPDGIGAVSYTHLTLPTSDLV